MLRTNLYSKCEFYGLLKIVIEEVHLLSTEYCDIIILN